MDERASGSQQSPWWTRPGALDAVAGRGRWPWRVREDDPSWWLTQIPLAVVVATAEIVATHLAAHRQLDRTALDALGYGLLAAGAASLPFRRRYPVTVLLFTCATTLAYWVLGYPGGPVFLPMVIAYFRVVIVGRRAVAWTVLAVGFVSFTWLPWLIGDEPRPSWGAVLGLAAWLLVIGTVAEMVRGSRERAFQVRRQLEEEERRRASEERLRIARELHDVLAHNISMINVQAGVALHLIDERPEQARPALTAIKQASKEALVELRSVLGVLRRVDEDGDGSRAPAPSLARLEELVAHAEAAGLDVRTEIEGRPRPLPAPVELAAFRIVQEALTNVVRHAGASSASVHVRYEADALALRIDDDGRGGPATAGWSEGTGIAGMRERVGSVGGSLSAGPRPGGGFRVEARLPLEEPSG